MNYQVTIDVRVDDVDALYDAAVKSYRAETGTGPGNLFGDEAGIEIGACLVQLLDPSTLPGVTIYESSAEAI